MPRPYNRPELAALRRTLDDKWPVLRREEADYWVGRWARGIAPYGRVRSHAIRLQLEAIIALARDCGLRRNEIFTLTEDFMHYDNLGVVVWAHPGPWNGSHREIPYTDRVRSAIWRWIEFRTLIGPEHDSPWLNLWAADTIRQRLRPDAASRLLRTYVGPEWSYRRLRDTCGVAWLNAGLPVEHVRRLLGLASLEATLPYARLAKGTLERRMARRGAVRRGDRGIAVRKPLPLRPVSRLPGGAPARAGVRAKARDLRGEPRRPRAS